MKSLSYKSNEMFVFYVFPEKNFFTEDITMIEKACIYESIFGTTFDLLGLLPVTCQRACAIVWILKCGQHNFGRFIMTGQLQFCQILDMENIPILLKLKSLAFLQVIALDKCGLQKFPNFTHFTQLQTLDIAYNNITELPNFKLELLKILNIEGNPIPYIDLDLDNFPYLEILTIGSNRTERISGQIIEKCASDESVFTLNIDTIYRPFLVVPLFSYPYTDIFRGRDYKIPGKENMIKDSSLLNVGSTPLYYSQQQKTCSQSKMTANQQRNDSTYRVNVFLQQSPNKNATVVIAEYFRKVKKIMDFRLIKDVETRYEASIYVLEKVNTSNNLYSLSLSFQKDFYQLLGSDGLDTFMNHYGLSQLRYLYLSNCILPKIPKVSKLTELWYLDLSSNMISNVGNELSNLIHLYHLDLSNNPIESIQGKLAKCTNLEYLNITETQITTIHFKDDEGVLNSLDTIECGSKHLRFISPSVLKQIQNSKLNIIVIEEHRDLLILPPYQTVNDMVLMSELLSQSVLPSWPTDKINVDQFCEAVSCFFEVQTFATIDLSNTDLGDERVQHLINISNFEHLVDLSLRKTGLEKTPDCSMLAHLQSLDLSQNLISNLNHLCSRTLVKLVVIGNLFSSLSLNVSYLPSLSELTFGSDNCHFVDFSVVRSDINLNVSNDYSQNLIFPPASALRNHQQRRDLLDSTFSSFNFQKLNMFSREKTYEYLIWLQRQEVNIEVCNLSHSTIGTLKLNSVFCGMPTIRELILHDCGLEYIPMMSSMLVLEKVDIRNNKLKIVACSSFPPSLKEINLVGNPIRWIDFDFSSLTHLEKVKCGSKNTHYLSLSLVKRVQNNNIVLKIPKRFVDYFHLPPPVAFHRKDNLKSYFDNPAEFLKFIRGRQDRLEVLNLLSSSDSYNLDMDFTGQTWTEAERNKLISINIQFLTLDSCSIKSWSQLKGLLRLRTLSLQNNCLKGIVPDQTMQLLETLNIADNPIKVIDFEEKDFPKLHHIIFGSKKSKFVTIRLLNRSLHNGLRLSVPEQYEKFLLWPTWSIIQIGGEALAKFIASTKLRFPPVNNPSEAKEAIQWSVKKSDKIFSVLDLSCQGKFYKKLRGHQMLNFFRYEAMRFVTEIYFTNCQLKFLPDWNCLKSLRFADLSGNCLEAIPSNPAVKNIDVTRNCIKTLDFKRRDFPKLCHIQTDLSLEYITFETLREFEVSFSRVGKNLLVMPPSLVLDDRSSLKDYLTHPERFLSSVNKANLSKAAHWFGSDADFSIEELDLSLEEKTYDALIVLNKMIERHNAKGLRSLDLSNSQLDCLPNLEVLSSLKTLTLHNNKIPTVSSLKHETLEVLDLTMNNMKIVDVNCEECPKLKELSIGSPKTKSLSPKCAKEDF